MVWKQSPSREKNTSYSYEEITISSKEYVNRIFNGFPPLQGSGLKNLLFFESAERRVIL
jgi:hypothetical protein